jgi:hypothetical protein
MTFKTEAEAIEVPSFKQRGMKMKYWATRKQKTVGPFETREAALKAFRETVKPSHSISDGPDYMAKSPNSQLDPYRIRGIVLLHKPDQTKYSELRLSRWLDGNRTIEQRPKYSQTA